MIVKPKQIVIQGHRGARGLLPENTIESCIEAVKCGVHGLEIDVVVSKDGQLVVSHEPWMSPLFCSFPNGKPVDTEGVFLYQMNYTDIQLFDCGQRGHPVFTTQKPIKTYKPTLHDLVTAVEDFCKNENKPIPFFNIEVKSHPTWYRKYVPAPSTFVQILQKETIILQNERYLSNFYISSFDPLFLKVLKNRMPRCTMAFLTENHLSLEMNLKRLGFKPQMYSPYYRFLTPKTLQNAHKMGVKIVTWTVNDKHVAQKLIMMGVDGLITDYPNLNYLT